jgi:hypothetical protein
MFNIKDDICSNAIFHRVDHPGCKTHVFLPARTPPFRQLYHDTETPAHLPELCPPDKLIII